MLASLAKNMAGLSISGPRKNLATLSISGTRNLATLSAGSTRNLAISNRCLATLTRGPVHQLLVAPSTTSLISVRTAFDAMDEYGRGETAKHGYGITLYDPKSGERTGLKAVELRFKRLDWGAWIRPRSGRDKKAWKKSSSQLRLREKHIFCRPYHKRRFDRAVLSEIKEARYIPDDPYKPYNDLSFQRYHSIRKKNAELIKKYAPQIYNFPWYRAHFRKNIIYTDKNRSFHYEPPGYHKAIADGEEVYHYDPQTPQNEPAPHYLLHQRHVSAVILQNENRHWRQIKRCESYYGPITNSHVLRLPVVGTPLG